MPIARNRSSLSLTNPLQLFLLRAYARLAPRRFDRRFVQRFLKPQIPVRAARERPDLPPPDEMMRIANGTGHISQEWVAAWRWGQGPAVLVVHGWEDDHHCFDAIIAALVKRGHAVVAFDLPAHGKSGGTQASIPLAADAIYNVAYALGPIRAVIGHSLGGAAATLAITQGLEVERAVVIAAPTGPTYAVDAMIKRLGLSKARREGIFEEIRRVVGVRPEEVELMPKIGSLETPALIVHSKDDPMVRFVTGEKWAATWPGAQLIAVEKLGHRRLLFDNTVAAKIVDFVVQPARGLQGKSVALSA